MTSPGCRGEALGARTAQAWATVAVTTTTSPGGRDVHGCHSGCATGRISGCGMETTIGRGSSGRRRLSTDHLTAMPRATTMEGRGIASPGTETRRAAVASTAAASAAVLRARLRTLMITAATATTSRGRMDRRAGFPGGRGNSPSATTVAMTTTWTPATATAATGIATKRTRRATAMRQRGLAMMTRNRWLRTTTRTTDGLAKILPTTGGRAGRTPMIGAKAARTWRSSVRAGSLKRRRQGPESSNTCRRLRLWRGRGKPRPRQKPGPGRRRLRPCRASKAAGPWTRRRRPSTGSRRRAREAAEM
mmetsp:Transcript_116316/g.290417  ORF Transcript_116316/g.290417 Transcript_116316/m.290417 type:complete len:305 (+) Transcript_116316:44-958(+)